MQIIPNESLYYRVDVVDKDDEADTFSKPVRVILLKSLEGKCLYSVLPFHIEA